MKMPEIDGCEMRECAYNESSQCHAIAITIGDSGDARCDTYFGFESKGGDPDQTGHVGACKMSDCVHNERLECTAGGIHVAGKGDQADCTTYRSK